jgi:hypothetical protein
MERRVPGPLRDDNMSGTSKVVLWILGVVCAVTIVAIGTLQFGTTLYRWYNPYLDQDVAGATTLSSEWVEIVPPRPLSAERQTNRIVLDVSDRYEPDYEEWSLLLPDGSKVKPEVQLVDEFGHVHDLTAPAIGERSMSLENFDLPKDREYVKVRIRAPRPLRLSRVYWHCYNQWDVS